MLTVAVVVGLVVVAANVAVLAVFCAPLLRNDKRGMGDG